MKPNGEPDSKGVIPRDIKQRTFEFSLAIFRLCRTLEKNSSIAGALNRQLLRSGTSVGANVEEAQAGQSRADFINKYAIALKEASETIYWLRLLQADDQDRQKGKECSQNKTPYGELINEAEELARIIGAIIVNTKSRCDK